MVEKQLTSNSWLAIFLFLILGLVTALLAIYPAIVMTEAGQALNVPRDWVIGYYSFRWVYIVINLILLASMWGINRRHQFMSRILMMLATIGVLLCIIIANFLLPWLFPTSQSTATYVSMKEADKFLKDQDVIYAVEINGDVRGFPRKHLEIPHIAGDTIGGEEVAMTFCALSNLPVVVDQNSDDKKMNLAILIQVHNNMVMKDKNSGDLIQQITGTKEFSGDKLKVYPNDLMSWGNFKKRYPEAKIFEYQYNRPLDAVLLSLFEGPMERQFDPDHGPMFPTLDLKDNRLPQKETVWGVDLNGEQTAFSKEFIEDNPIYQFQLAGKPLVLVYDKDLDTVSLFDRELNGQTARVEAIDIDGNVAQGKLTKLPMHNGLFWMIWSHWYPESGLNG